MHLFVIPVSLYPISDRFVHPGIPQKARGNDNIGKLIYGIENPK